MKNNSGFSLIEMMVAVAIVSVLSSIALPNFQLLIARARQSEAKSAMISIYAIEKNFKAEYGRFTVCLYQAGYLPPAGASRYYATGFYGASTTATRFDGAGRECMWTGGIEWGGYARDDSTFMQNTAANPALERAAPSSPVWDVTETTFRAVAFGSVASYLGIQDIWSIDQDKKLVNEQRGY